MKDTLITQGVMGMSVEQNRLYEEGVQDGRLKALEFRVDAQDNRAGSHERRLQYLERIVYGIMAIVAFTSVLPEFMEAVGGFVK